jgi:DNA-binding XRE family transcriptional regulator
LTSAGTWASIRTDDRFQQRFLPEPGQGGRVDGMNEQPAVTAALDQIAPRLRRAREKKGVTLAALARVTGVSTSTLSRLESGQPRPSLELLRAYQVMIPARDTEPTPRTHRSPSEVNGRNRTFVMPAATCVTGCLTSRRLDAAEC